MKTFKQFNQQVSWSTRIYVLMAITLMVSAFVLNAWSGSFALAVALSLAVVLLSETLILSVKNHPRTWHVIGWTLLLLLLLFLLIGVY